MKKLVFVATLLVHSMLYPTYAQKSSVTPLPQREYRVRSCESSEPAKEHSALVHKLTSQVPGWLKDANVPSIAISYVANNEVAVTLVCGEQAPKVPATTKTLYNTASIAKPLVAEIALRLATSNRISLDEAMSSYWLDPDISDDKRHSMLTPRMALAHQSGFANWRRLTGGKLGFQSTPGTETSYSGEGILYVVKYLERRLDTNFRDLAQEVLFEPAGMREISFVGEDWFSGRVAWRKPANDQWTKPDLNDAPLGAGDVWTTSSSYARFLLWLLQDANSDSTSAMERRTITVDETSKWCGPDKVPEDFCPRKMGFSQGWYLYEFEDHTLFAHNGSNEGEKTLALFSPDLGIALVALTNGENGKRVIARILDTLYPNPSFKRLEGY